MAPRTIAPGIALLAVLGCWEPNHFDPNYGATTGPKGTESGDPSGPGATSAGGTDPTGGTSAAPATSTAAASESDGDPSTTFRPQDPPPQVKSFSVTPHVLYLADHATLDAAFSTDVVEVDILEIIDGADEVLADDLAPADFPFDLLMATAADNGLHTYKLRARDALDQSTDSNIDTLTVLLPPGGTALGTVVSDYDEKSQGYAVTPRADGGSFIVGAFENGGWAAFARGYAKDGTLPINVMPTDGIAIANALAPAGNGDVYVVGNYDDNGGGYLARVTPMGDVTLLDKLGEKTVGRAVALVGDRVLVAGHAPDPDDQSEKTDDLRVWIYDALATDDPPLEIAWQPDDESEFAFADDEAVAIAADGDRVIVVGQSEIQDKWISRSRLVALHVGLNGAILDEVLHAPKGLAVAATAVTVTPVGDAILGGWSAPLVSNPPRQPALFGLSAELELTTELHDLPGIHEVRGVAALPNKRVVVATDIAGVGGTDILLRGVAWPSGVQTWAYTYKGSQGGDDHVHAVAAEPAGIVHFTGHTQVGGAPRALVGRVHP